MAISKDLNTAFFVSKLYQILSETRYKPYIQWGKDGASFIIADTPEFNSIVLAENFKHRNMSSFVRQLNKYGFRKLKCSESVKDTFGMRAWEFSHKNFRQGREDLLFLISRKSASAESQSGSKAESDELSESSETHLNLVRAVENLTRYFEVIIEDLAMIRRHICEPDAGSGITPLRVLIAEDNPQCAAYASMIFRRNFCSVVCAESPKEISFFLGFESYDIFFISGSIPDVTEILYNLRKTSSSSLIIVAAEQYIGQDEWKKLFPVADRILTKPYSHDHLSALVRSHQLRIRRSPIGNWPCNA